MVDKMEGQGGPPPQDTPTPPPQREDEPQGSSEKRELTPDEQRERAERALDLLAVEFLVESRKVNEGNNGVILHFDVEAANPELKQLMKETGIEFGNEKAVKVLKMYRGGEGKKEYEMQKAAFDVLDGDPETEAIIPTPLFYRDVQLNPELASKLREQGVSAGERVEVIMMDFVKGQDLAHVLTSEALVRAYPAKRGAKVYESAAELSHRTVDDILKELRPVLDMRDPAASRHDADAKRRVVEQENAAKMYDFLAQDGFTLDPTILNRLKNTLDKLHRAGIVHGDAHERNFMIAGEYSYTPGVEGSAGSENTVYLIDFGTAKTFSGNYEANLQEIYREGESLRPQDEMVLRYLKPLTETPQERNERKRRESFVEVEKLLEAFRRSEVVVSKRNAWFERNDGKPIDASKTVPAFFKFFFKQQTDFSSGRKWEQFTDYVFSFVEKGVADPSDVSAAVNQLKEAVHLIPVKNKLSRLSQAVALAENKGRHED